MDFIPIIHQQILIMHPNILNTISASTSLIVKCNTKLYFFISTAKTMSRFWYKKALFRQFMGGIGHYLHNIGHINKAYRCVVF